MDEGKESFIKEMCVTLKVESIILLEAYVNHIKFQLTMFPLWSSTVQELLVGARRGGASG